jgi:DNA-directed RNA polymerase subunit RPC12/RpoP
MPTVEKAKLGDNITGVKCGNCKKEALRLAGRYKNEFKIECQNCFTALYVKDKTNEAVVEAMKEKLNKNVEKKNKTNNENDEEQAS